MAKVFSLCQELLNGAVLDANYLPTLRQLGTYLLLTSTYQGFFFLFFFLFVNYKNRFFQANFLEKLHQDVKICPPTKCRFTPNPPSSARVNLQVPHPFEVCYDQPDFRVSFNGELSPNFDLKNMISTFTKDISWKI